MVFLAAIIACNQKYKTEQVTAVETQVISDVVTIDEVPPPPPNLTSDFKNIQEWLTSICKTEKPDINITDFRLGLFESPNDNTIFLVGIINYDNDEGSETRFKLKPANMYFPLPQSEFSNMNHTQLLDKLTEQLRAFTTTETFRNSFLAAAKRITFDASGKVIWPK